MIAGLLDLCERILRMGLAGPDHVRHPQDELALRVDDPALESFSSSESSAVSWVCVARLVPRGLVWRVSIYVIYLLLLGLAMTLTLPGAHRLARTSLAVGFACMVGPWILRRERAFAGLIARTVLPGGDPPLDPRHLELLGPWHGMNSRALAALKPAALGFPECPVDRPRYRAGRMP